MSFKDTTPLIIQIDSDTIKAGRGLAELLETPSVIFKARYGLRRPTTSSAMDIDPPPTASTSTSAFSSIPPPPSPSTPISTRPLSDYLISTTLDDILAKEGADAVDIFWPFEVTEENEAMGMMEGKAGKRVVKGRGGSKNPGGKGREEDWRGREAILHYIFYTAFQLQPTTNLSTLLLIPPATELLSPPTLSNYTQIAFETLNVPALHILDPALASLYGVGSHSGLAVMFGRRETVIDVVWEGQVKSEARVVVDVGKEDCVIYLSDLLSRDATIKEQIHRFGTEVLGGEGWNDEANAMRELAEEILDHEKLREGKVVRVALASGDLAALGDEDAEEEDGLFNVAKVLIQNDASKSIQQLKDSKSKKSAAQQAADAAKAEAVVLAAQQAARAESLADIYAFEIPLLPGKRIRVGPIRHRGCEPLYREMGSVKQGKTGRTVQEGMAAAVASLEKDLRQPVWVGVVFSGEMAKVPSLPYAILSYLNSYLPTSEDHATDFQPAQVRLLKIPDYYANFRGNATDVAPFLGGSIAAKIAFTDNRDQNCITKAMYNQYGPGASHLATAME